MIFEQNFVDYIGIVVEHALKIFEYILAFGQKNFDKEMLIF